MTPRQVTALIYGCHSLPQQRKDAILGRLLEAAGRSGLARWKDLLARALAVREDFFRVLSPRHKERILGDLARAIRSMTKAACSEEAWRVLDEIYAAGDGPAAGGEAAAYFRMRLGETPERRVRAMLAAVLMELPEAGQYLEDAAAAVHGDHLLAIRAMEKLCACGDHGMRALLPLLAEIPVTPAVTYTLLGLIDQATCDETLRLEMVAAVLRKASASALQAGKAGMEPEPAVVSLRSSQAVHAKRTSDPVLTNLKRPVQKDPVFLRFKATRATKRKGASHVGQENHTDAALRRGSPACSGGPGGERIRLSAKLKRDGVPAEL